MKKIVKLIWCYIGWGCAVASFITTTKMYFDITKGE